MTKYPLTWPAYKRRTPAHERRASDFGLRRASSAVTPDRAQRELMNEISLLGGHGVILSTNIRLRVDGTPYRDERPVNGDPGVAVYFKRKGKDLCFACDKWSTVPENIWAIRKSIEALRGLERWGSKEMMESAFTGFAALPAPEQWFQVLGIPASSDPTTIKNAYAHLASKHHPDKGGDADLMTRINRARDQGMENWQ